MSSQHQINREDAEGKNHHCQSTSLHFFAGDARPIEAKPLSILASKEALHRLNRLSRTLAGRRCSLDFDRAVEIEMRHHTGAYNLLHRKEFSQRNLLLTAAILHIQGSELLGSSTTIRLSLHIHASHFALLECVIHIQTTKVNAERLHRRTKINVKRSHAITIHLDLNLRRFWREEGVNALQVRISTGGLNDLQGVGIERRQVVSPATLIKQLEFKTAAGAIAGDGRGFHHKRAGANHIRRQLLV